MRIAHVEAGRHLYGGPRQVQYLIDGLAARGVENLLLCPSEQSLARSVTNARVVTLPMRGDLDVGLLPRLARALAAEAPDLVHVHSRRGADLYGGLAAERAGIPAVLTRRVDGRGEPFLARLKYRPYRKIVAISRAVAAGLGRDGVAAERIALIPSAVDTGRFAPDVGARHRLEARFGFGPEDVVVGLVAQLIERKGHRLAFAALAALAARHPRLKLVCAGRGPLEAALGRALEEHGLVDRVELAGYCDDVADWLPGLDALVHPALSEGLGVAVLEAMSAGVPVVASTAGGLVDLIEDGRDGLLVPAGDADALAAALDGLLADRALGARLGGAGRARVVAAFTIDAMADAYAALYRTAVAGPAYA